MSATICQDCGERPADPTRDDSRCRECGEDIDAMYASLCDACGDAPADKSGDDGLCPACRRLRWLDETEEWLEAAAARHGWTCRLTSMASTGSRYYTLQRVDEETDVPEEVKVRISDHWSAHCSEDYSIAMRPSGDDHTRDDVERRLAKEMQGGRGEG